MLFTLNICPEKAAQAVVLDTHTPTKFRQANPPDILSAGDAVDGMEEWLRIIQRHCCRRQAQICMFSCYVKCHGESPTISCMLAGAAALFYNWCHQLLLVAGAGLCCTFRPWMNVCSAADLTIPPCTFSYVFLGLLYIASCQPGSIMHTASVCSLLAVQLLNTQKTSHSFIDTL